jgi:high-affinity nickel-transport protein
MPAARRARLFGYFGTVGLLHAAGWTVLLGLLVPRHPAMLGLGVLAFSFGLRHAFDADHIAAIDNVTRRLLQDEEPAEGTGFYFSLGHSTIVFLLAAALALGARAVAARIPGLERAGGVAGTAVSGAFLYLIAGLNAAVLLDLWGLFRRMRPGAAGAGPAAEAELEGHLLRRGLMNRLLGRFAALVRRPRDMYPVGVLFGLGFDTASEVALLAISAGAASRHLPFWGVLCLPVLFAAGMSLMDTADGVFMTSAYGWAFATPVRRAYYNLTVTGLSVAVAALVGTVEVAQVVAGRAGLAGPFWTGLQNLDFARLGYVVVALFACTWAASYAIWKVARVEERWRGPTA